MNTLAVRIRDRFLEDSYFTIDRLDILNGIVVSQFTVFKAVHTLPFMVGWTLEDLKKWKETSNGIIHECREYTSLVKEVCVWPDKMWAYIEELSEYNSKSDDYIVIGVPVEADDDQIDLIVESFKC